MDGLPLIKNRIHSSERPEDVVEMIEILANERISRLPESSNPQRSDRHYDFSAKVLCIIFDIFKDPDYNNAIRNLRLQYVGISENSFLRSVFRKSLSTPLLRERDERKVIEGIKQFVVDRYFKPNANFR